MTSDAPVIPHHHDRLPRRRLWFGAAAAAVSWVVYSIASVFVTWQACQDAQGDWLGLSERGVRWLLGVLCIVAAVVALAGLLVSISNWRSLPHPLPFRKALAEDREVFMAVAGIFVSACFVLAILWAGVGPIVLDVCVFAK